MKIRTNAPRQGVWIFSVILGLVSLVSHLIHVEGVTVYTAYWVMGIAWLLLVLSTYFRKF